MSGHQIKLGIDSDDVDREKILNTIESGIEKDIEIQNPPRKLSGVEQDTIVIISSLVFHNKESLVEIIRLLRDVSEVKDIIIELNDGYKIQPSVNIDVNIEVDISEINLIKLVHEDTGNE